MKAQLSIVIPSVRASDAKRNLLHALDELKRSHEDTLEICLFENGQNGLDVTFYPDITYSNSKDLLSIDNSMLMAFSMAHHEWIWGVGDDTIVNKERIANFLSRLENNSFFDSDVILLMGDSDEVLNLKISPVNLFIKMWDRLSFGRIVMKKSFFNLATWDKYSGTHHAYSGLIWDGFSNLDTINVAIVDRHIVTNSLDEKTYRNNIEEIYFYSIPQFINLLPNVLPKNFALSQFKKRYYSFKGIYTLRNEGLRYSNGLPRLIRIKFVIVFLLMPLSGFFKFIYHLKTIKSYL